MSGNSLPLPEARAIDSSLWTTEAAFLTPGCPGCFAALKGKSTWEGATVGESQQPPERALKVQQAELGGGGPSSKMATYVQHAIAPISGPLWERPPILQTGCIHLGRRNSSTGPFKQLRRGWNCEAPCSRPSPRQLDIHVCTLGYLLSSQGSRSCPHASSGRSRRLSLLSSLWPSPAYHIPI